MIEEKNIKKLLSPQVFIAANEEELEFQKGLIVFNEEYLVSEGTLVSPQFLMTANGQKIEFEGRVVFDDKGRVVKGMLAEPQFLMAAHGKKKLGFRWRVVFTDSWLVYGIYSYNPQRKSIG